MSRRSRFGLAAAAGVSVLMLGVAGAGAQSAGLRPTQELTAAEEEANFVATPLPRPDEAAAEAEDAEQAEAEALEDVPQRIERSARERREADRRRQRGGLTDPDDPAADALVEIVETDAADEEPALGARADRVARASERASPVETGTGSVETEPFAATGLRLGSFVVRPSLESGIAAETSKDEGADPLTSVFSENTARLLLNSDWAQHSAEIDAFVRSRQRLSGTGPNETEIGGDATLRLDLTRDTTVTLDAGYNRSPEDPATSATTSAAINRPIVQRLNGSAALRQQFGPAFGQVQAAVEHETFGAAELADGTTRAQSDLDNTLVVARLRAGYALSEAIAPFAEAELGRRVHAQTPDSFGLNRDATRFGLRAGTELDFGEKLNGEVSAGWISEDIADPALRDIAALRLDGSLNWSPRRGTTVNLSGSTAVQGSSVDGESGAVLYTGSLGVTHQARANLTTTANLSATQRDVRGPSADTLSLSAESGFTWWFSRYLGLSGRVRHERVLSDDSGERSTTNSAFLGLKLQR